MGRHRGAEQGTGRPRHRRRLSKRIFLHGLLLLGVTAVAAGVAARAFTTQAPWQNFPEKIANYLVSNPHVALDDPRALRGELDRIREHFGIALSIYRPDHQLLASSATPPLSALDAADLAELHAGPLWVKRGTLAVPLRRGGQLWAYAVGNHPRSQASIFRGAAIFFAILGAIAAMSVPLARSIARPLERLTQVVRAFGSGDLSVRAQMCRSDEVGELGDAFDEMASRLQAMIRNERELLANVSHELRTPIARIRIALELAAEGDAVRAQKYLSEIGTDLAELERVIEDVFAAARLDLATTTGNGAAPPLRKETIPAEQLIARAAEKFRQAHPDRPLQVNVSGPLPAVDADPQLLRRVIDNLLDNARKYSDKDKEIALRASTGDGSVIVEVKDRGIGIDPADQTQLFTPFFRTDKSRARGTGGVGLGLALARRIVEAHGGTISVASTPGEGSTFSFRVPARPA